MSLKTRSLNPRQQIRALAKIFNVHNALAILYRAVLCQNHAEFKRSHLIHILFILSTNPNLPTHRSLQLCH